MRFHFILALSASFITALLADWPEDNLFDVSNPLEEASSSYLADDSLQDLFQPPVTPDLAENSSPVALQCTSSGSDELMRKAKTRREEGICPSPIFSGDIEGFNMERWLRGRIQAIQDRAQRERRVLPFCPPPTLPLCCVGEPDYLGMQVHDCQLCMSAPRASNLPCFPS